MAEDCTSIFHSAHLRNVTVGDIHVEKHIHMDRISHYFQLPPVNPQSIPRPALLNKLATALASAHQAVITQNITGLGGIGKTHLVCEYVQAVRNRNFHSYDYIFWLHAEISLGSQFQMLARDYSGLIECTILEAIENVYQFLRGKSALLIFDNVGDSSSLIPYLPPPEHRSPLHIIITSRNPNWGTTPSLVLDCFTPEETQVFFEKELGCAQDFTWIRVLHEVLGGLPLALSQALSYIKEKKISIEKYLQDFQKNKEHFFGKEELIDNPHSKTIGTTITLSLRQACERAPLAEYLLHLTAYLASENIPVSFLIEYCSRNVRDFDPSDHLIGHRLHSLQYREHFERIRYYADYYRLDRDFLSEGLRGRNLTDIINRIRRGYILPEIEALAAYSLVTFDPSSQSIRVHRLVQAALRYQHEKVVGGIRYLYEMMFFLQSYLHYEERDFFRLTIVRHSLSHAIACAGFARVLLYPQPPFDYIGLLLEIGRVSLDDLSDVEQAKLAYEEVLSLQQNESHIDEVKVACTLSKLGIVYGIMGDTRQKKDFLERALHIFEKYPDRKPSERVMVLVHLGKIYGEQLGGRDKQVELFTQAQQMVEQTYDLNSPEMATIFMHLGKFYHDSKGFDKAKDYLEKSRMIFENCYDARHPKLATALRRLSDVYADLGDRERSESLLRKAQVIFQYYYGDDYLKKSEIFTQQLAGSPGEKPKLPPIPLVPDSIVDKEGDKFREVLEILKIEIMKVAHLASERNDITLLEKVLSVLNSFHFDHNLDVACVFINLGKAYNDACEPIQSMKAFKKALIICVDSDDTTNFQAIDILVKLANAMSDIGNKEWEKSMLEQILTVFERYPSEVCEDQVREVRELLQCCEEMRRLQVSTYAALTVGQFASRAVLVANESALRGDTSEDANPQFLGRETNQDDVLLQQALALSMQPL